MIIIRTMAEKRLVEEEEEEEHRAEDDEDFWTTRRGYQKTIRRPSQAKKASESGQFRIEEDSNLFNFTRIGGYHSIKSEMRQVMDMMMNPDNYTQYKVRVPRGILLEGPPGNGKTLLAKCFAGEIEANFIRCSGAEFNEMYIGVGSSRLRELFKLARENQPCVLFIDEFDAIGRRRGGSEDSSGGERDTTLNQLLTLMDGFESLGRVLIMGATNRVDILDKAATRPGRFDKIIHIPNPDASTRREILTIHCESKPIEVELEEMVRMTAGFSGAMIENMVNEATLFGIRNATLPVSRDMLETVRQQMVFGMMMGTRNISAAILRRIAIHESGHLINALATRYYERPIRVSIETQNVQSLGMTVFQKEDVDDGIFLREYVDEKIRVLLGGRAAEEMMYGESLSSGSVSDLEAAFELTKKMILQFGMGRHIIYPFLSEEYKKRIDKEIHQYIHQSYQAASRILVQNRPLLETLVERLLETTTIQEKEIAEILTIHPLVVQSS